MGLYIIRYSSNQYRITYNQNLIIYIRTLIIYNRTYNSYNRGEDTFSQRKIPPFFPDYISFSLGGGKKWPHERLFRLYLLFSYLFTAEPADRPHTNLVEHALSIPQVCWLPLRSNFWLRTINFPLLSTMMPRGSLFSASIPRNNISANNAPSHLKSYEQLIQRVIHHPVWFGGHPFIGWSSLSIWSSAIDDPQRSSPHWGLHRIKKSIHLVPIAP